MRGALFQALGVDGSEHPRIIGALQAADFDAIVRAVQVQDPAGGGSAGGPPPMLDPTPAQLSQAGLLGRACRVSVGTQPSAAAAAAAQAAAQTAVKMAGTINQTDDTEVDILDEHAIKIAYKNYHNRIGAFPPAEEELSKEQLSTLWEAFRSGGAPYTDMAVWGPHHHRIQKKIRLRGVKIAPTGEVTSIELTGPADFEDWRACYAVFKVGCIMFEQITPARLDAYEKHLRGFHERYGRQCWALIYQADVRARLELSERLRRVGKDEKERADATSTFHDFDPTKPREWVWSKLTSDVQFWLREVQEPAVLVLARTASLHQMIDHDAPIMQTGECTDHDARNNCRRIPRLKHQCGKCLSIDHGANSCALKTDLGECESDLGLKRHFSSSEGTGNQVKLKVDTETTPDIIIIDSETLTPDYDDANSYATDLCRPQPKDLATGIKVMYMFGGPTEREENWRRLKAHRSEFYGILTAPPCNTFTRARRKRRDGRGGPPPLRGPEEHDRYGLKHLKPEDQDKDKKDTPLALRLGDMLASNLKDGAPTINEQPHFDQHDAEESMYNLDEFQMVRKAEGIGLHDLDQYECCAVTEKRSSILTIGNDLKDSFGKCRQEPQWWRRPSTGEWHAGPHPPLASKERMIPAGDWRRSMILNDMQHYAKLIEAPFHTSSAPAYPAGRNWHSIIKLALLAKQNMSDKPKTATLVRVGYWRYALVNQPFPVGTHCSATQAGIEERQRVPASTAGTHCSAPPRQQSGARMYRPLGHNDGSIRDEAQSGDRITFCHSRRGNRAGEVKYRERENELYIGGMRLPMQSTGKMQDYGAFNEQLRHIIEQHLDANSHIQRVRPDAIGLEANAAGPEADERDDTAITLGSLLETENIKGVVNDTYDTPIRSGTRAAWVRRAKDSDGKYLEDWLKHGASAGLEVDTEHSGILPKVDDAVGEHAQDTPDEHDDEPVLHNYSWVGTPHGAVTRISNVAPIKDVQPLVGKANHGMIEAWRPFLQDMRSTIAAHKRGEMRYAPQQCIWTKQIAQATERIHALQAGSLGVLSRVHRFRAYFGYSKREFGDCAYEPKAYVHLLGIASDVADEDRGPPICLAGYAPRQCLAASSSSGLHPPAGGDIRHKPRRQFAERTDAPQIEVTRGGPKQTALAAARSEDSRHVALARLQENSVAASAKRTKDSLLKTWQALHFCWFSLHAPMLPLTAVKLQAVGALVKADKYESVAYYLTKIRELHLVQGGEWFDQPRLEASRVTRSVLRGPGPGKQEEPINLTAIIQFAKGGKNSDLPVTPSGPVSVGNITAASVFFMLRVIESPLTLYDNVIIDSDRQEVKWIRPGSKADPATLSTSRTRGRLCETVFSLARPFHAAKRQMERTHRSFTDLQGVIPPGLPFFPTMSGKTVQKEEGVATYETMRTMAGLPTQDADGNRLLGGHSARLGGARTLAPVGWHIYLFELMARRQSPMLIHYAKEAPLHKITQEFVEKKRLLLVIETLQALRVRLGKLATRVKQGTGAASREAISQLNVKIDEAYSRTAAALQMGISDLRCGRHAPTKVATTKNNATGSRHTIAIEGIHIEPGLWHTRYGWMYGRSSYSSRSGELPEDVDMKRVGEKGFGAPPTTSSRIPPLASSFSFSFC
ncbi:unnamed protein product [Prorocentrum cordatum]|uniref:Uncharacterized protein n=1 Tax=Prorocentrum cordatum TaxID=2364126 RepID=A0ABN9S6S5_9DINO|nr:unnamed protein product [Polarella glacialis]